MGSSSSTPRDSSSGPAAPAPHSALLRTGPPTPEPLPVRPADLDDAEDIDTLSALVASAAGSTGGKSIAEYVLSKINEVLRTPVKIALIGVRGTGKSTLINTLRNLDNNNDDPRCAKTDEAESTLVRTSYPHPDAPNIELFDVPGVSMLFPRATYVDVMGLASMDVIVLVTHKNVTEDDAFLREAVEGLGKLLFLVRSQLDSVSVTYSPVVHDFQLILSVYSGRTSAMEFKIAVHQLRWKPE